MSDARLREAERRWREGGRLDDRLRWWSERARAGDLPAGAEALVVAVSTGDLDPDRVELAAYLGDERARALAGEEVVERVAYGGSEGALRVAHDDAPELRLDDVLDWIGELRLWDAAVVQRALVAATQHLADDEASRDLSRAEDESEWVLQSVREAERERSVTAARDLLGALQRWIEGRGEGAPPSAVAGRAPEVWQPHAGPLLAAARVITGIVLARAARTVTPIEAEQLLEWRRTVRESAPDPRALRDAVRAALVPWALAEEAP